MHSLNQVCNIFKTSKYTDIFMLHLKRNVIGVTSAILGEKSWNISSSFCQIIRLNSGIFRIFEPIRWNLNLNNSDCRAWKIIQNDTKAESIPWEMNIENPKFYFCVGVWLGGHPRLTGSLTRRVTIILVTGSRL